MPQVAAKLGDAVTIWHQSGKGGQQTVQQAYAAAGQPQHKVTEFIDDMAAYAWADVVVCRSGALTVSEIAAAGLPALFVPFQHKDRQQYWNALPLEKAGAAKILEQPQFTVEAVASTLASWDRETLAGYGGTSAWRFDSGRYRTGSRRSERRSFGALIAVIFTARIKKLMA
jgi:UDP-N-acetylglucosamine--N-acetylmuramyl-(pentapeptide) pyrophosphoryl-undecaprenol N-acetylglucosamine transferase